MTEDYLQIMVESLQKKNDVLDKITELEKRQLTLALKQPPDLEAYDALMDVKGNLIDELGRLDDGFTHTYELVKDEVQKKSPSVSRAGTRYAGVDPRSNRKRRFY